MDDPIAIANAFAADAKKVVTQTQTVMRDAVTQINANPGPPIGFTAGDAVKTMTKLVKIAMNGGIAFGQTALEVKPTQGVLILADHLATLATQSVNQVAAVADEVADLIATDKYDRHAVVHTAIKLANVALLNGADAVQTVAAGPAQYANPIKKQKYTLPADPANARTITVGQLKLSGLGQTPVPAYQIGLDPANGILPAGATEFTLVVNSAGLASGTYVGTIGVNGPDNAFDATVSVTLLL
jgi:hypothetical protein